MKIGNGIEMLEISAEMMGAVQTIHPVLIWDDNEALLIDTGFPGQLPLFKGAFEKAGVRMDSLSTILITHQDIDHIGSLSALLDEAERAIKVLASSVEQPYIQGDKRLLKITDEAISKVEASLPSDIPEQWKQSFISILKNPPKAPVDRVITKGEVLDIGGGLTVLATPGHTPGHISLFHHASKTLIAGDAMVVENGELQGPSPAVTIDMKSAMLSLKQLLELDIDKVICYHGGLYEGNIHNRIKQILEQK
ncbi:MBL fold metallo-hydrolase [Falsibacillus pallidus]|uniref:Glyoxylase-like metal-dependent hydrolase (Beta-lactamase superfamily II) n=1 Tax=Falsibacillus pallidus TaxID=493781 RepID=A0A370GD61_9BACI|nr:MBL fold metallo-hydrolase [Falsibacillus pallidus]RDI39903.1 glyoxylase-like metal-dependent hydrolase (beta-lactamase superfamily II) [Falsibacillus pallidus]